jgi:hypothetical protein
VTVTEGEGADDDKDETETDAARKAKMALKALREQATVADLT